MQNEKDWLTDTCLDGQDTFARDSHEQRPSANFPAPLLDKKKAFLYT